MKIVLELDMADMLLECFEAEDGVSQEQLKQVVGRMLEEGDLDDVAIGAIYEFVQDKAHEYIARYFDKEASDER